MKIMPSYVFKSQKYQMKSDSKPNNAQIVIQHAFQELLTKVHLWSFQVGDLVLAIRRPNITTHKNGNKFTSNWDGPYVVQEVYTNGVYKIVIKDEFRIGSINGKFLKRYYA